MPTYKDYIASRQPCEDLRTLEGTQFHDDIEQYQDAVEGYIYFNSYWIVDCSNPEMGFYVMVGVEERYYATLEETEKFLWDNFVNGDQNGSEHQ